MGAPKKPMALRELHGTANRNKQRNNDDAPTPERGIGPAPAHFNELQSDIWDYLVGVMFAGVLGSSDRPTFELLTVLFWRFRHGGYEQEATIPALAVGEMTLMNNIMAKYGMNPSDRQRIVVPKGEKKNPFELL
jgi:hypothetical protein